MSEALIQFIFLGLLIGVFYMMLIRPQKRRAQQHRNLITSLDVGDEIVTIGGMYGRIRSIGDEEIEVEVAAGTTVRFVKSAIARRLTENLEADEPAAAAEEEQG